MTEISQLSKKNEGLGEGFTRAAETRNPLAGD
jgi:hypothetical protein